MYRDRAQAGRHLADLLKPVQAARPIVLGLARGGVAIGCEIAMALKAPLSALIVRKLGAPLQPELALGAIADLGEIVSVFNDEILAELGMTRDRLAGAIALERAELERRGSVFNRIAPIPELAGRTVIVVDDGIATGATARAALRAVRAKGAGRVILAAPCGAKSSLKELSREADEIVCPIVESGFGSVGQYYQEFDQLTDAEVIDCLSRAKASISSS